MKSSTTALVFALVASFSLAAADTDEIPAEGGTIAITPIMHGSVQVEFGGKVIQVDPWSDGDYSAAKKADLILVTDIHGDHLDPEAIANIKKDGAAIVVPSAAADKVEGETILSNGKRKKWSASASTQCPCITTTGVRRKESSITTRGRGNGYIPHARWQARVFFRRHRLRARDQGARKHRRGLHDHEPPLHDVPRGGGGMRARIRAEDRLSVPLSRLDLNVFVSALKDKSNIEVRVREWYGSSSN